MIKEFLNIIIDWILMIAPYGAIGIGATKLIFKIFNKQINKFFA